MKVLFLIGLLLISGNLYAAQITIDVPNGEQTRVLNGLTKDGQECQVGESSANCAKRMIIRFIKNEVKTWDDYKAKKSAVDAVVPAIDPGVS